MLSLSKMEIAIVMLSRVAREVNENVTGAPLPGVPVAVITDAS
jgi:hypothetical protein